MSLILTIFLYNAGILYSKMSLTQAQINRLQKLTAIAREGELDISSVLDSFDALKNGNLNLPENTTRSGKWSLLPREDVVHASTISRESLLKCSKQRIAGNQIALSSIMIGE